MAATSATKNVRESVGLHRTRDGHYNVQQSHYLFTRFTFVRRFLLLLVKLFLCPMRVRVSVRVGTRYLWLEQWQMANGNCHKHKEGKRERDRNTLTYTHTEIHLTGHIA